MEENKTIPDQLWSLLTSHGKLDRDRGLQKLQDTDPLILFPLIERLKDFRISGNGDQPWETRLGFLLASKAILDLESGDIDFIRSTTTVSIKMLTDEEVRVRLAAGETLGSLCSRCPDVFDECHPVVMNLIRENLHRDDDDDEPEVVQETTHKNKAAIFHETAGWRNLETSMKCLQKVLEGCSNISGIKNKLLHDHDVLTLIFTSLSHLNRFVRETGFYTLSTLITMMSGSDDTSGDEFETFGLTTADQLGRGLADNWSQVRLAATTATRTFMVRIPPALDPVLKHRIQETLMPRICLNRYYLAEGVRIYSQETWKLVTMNEHGGSGRQTVIDHLEHFVRYYVDCTVADNHAVREAACQCIAELAAKIDKSSLSPYVDKLLDTLLKCFKDDSWPVRDMACVASGKFVLSYPEESERVKKDLEHLFYENLEDSIPSVRQGAALSIGNLIRAYNNEPEMVDRTISRIRASLQAVKYQKAQEPVSEEVRENSGALGTFGIVKRARDNDADLHENQVMYSCGSLAPKMSRTGGGCSDCRFKRPSEPWEKADGAVHLITVLSDIPEMGNRLQGCLLDVAEACRIKHYVSHYFFLETVMKNLPLIARNLGKKAFKATFLEEFLDPMFYAANARMDNALAAAAGTKCIADLSDLIGPNIFRGRVEQYNPKYLGILETALEESLVGGPYPNFFPSSGNVPRSAPIPMEVDPQRQPSLGGTPTGSPK